MLSHSNYDCQPLRTSVSKAANSTLQNAPILVLCQDWKGFLTLKEIYRYLYLRQPAPMPRRDTNFTALDNTATDSPFPASCAPTSYTTLIYPAVDRLSPNMQPMSAVGDGSMRLGHVVDLRTVDSFDPWHRLVRRSSRQPLCLARPELI